MLHLTKRRLLLFFSLITGGGQRDKSGEEGQVGAVSQEEGRGT